ncbi:oligosaccharide flippase family protein [Luteimonas sp. MJ174]|uniref:lipopolysaccharide biosynthesis protein n=1 Tax=Luteimonas sp. MJ174 TaxID=3129237 RepID=UPI0031BAFEF3
MHVLKGSHLRPVIITLARQQSNQLFSGVSAFRGAMMVTGSTYVTYALGMLTSIVIARTLGPDDFGRYAYVVWLAGLLVMLANNGITTTAIRFVSESLGRGSGETAGHVHGWLLKRQLASAALVTIAFLVFLPQFKPTGWDREGLGLFAVATLAAGMCKAWFIFDVSIAKGYGHYGIEAGATVTMSLLNIGAVLLLLWTGAGLDAYVVLFALVGAGHAVAGWTLRRRAGLLPARGLLDAALQPRVRNHLWWTVLLVLAWALGNKSIETWLLNRTAGAAAVGYFAIAAALTRGGIDMLSSGLGTVLMPMMSHAFGAGGSERAGVIVAGAVRYYAALGLLLAGAGALAAPTLVVLLYGDAYGAVVLPLQVMVVVGGLTMAEGAFGALMSTTDNQKLRVGFVVLSLLVTASLAIYLVPRHGLAGAVLAHAVSRVLVFAVTWVGITRLLDLRMPWRELLRLVAAAATALLPALVLLRVLPELWGGLVAAVAYVLAYAAASVGYRAWRREDARILVGLGQRYPRLGAWVNTMAVRFCGGGSVP